MNKHPGFRLYLATGAVLSLTALLAAQDADPSQNQKLRDRYQQVLIANPQPGTAFDRLFKNYADTGELDLWLATLTEKAKDPAQAAVCQLLIGLIHERRGADAQALEAYGLSVKADPKKPRALAAQGLLLAKTGRHEQAAKSLQAAIDLNPPAADLQNLYKALGRAYASANQPDNAVKAWLTLADLTPNDTATREELAGFLVEEARPVEAAAQYEKLRATTTDGYQKVRAVFALAQLYAAQGKHDQAIALLSEQLNSLAPDSWLRAETHRRLELAFNRTSGLSGLADFYAKWLTDHPDDLDVRLTQAALYSRLAKPAEAAQAYEAALAKAPTRADIRASLANLLLEQGNRAQAIALYEKAAADQPANPALWERLGTVLLADPEKSPKSEEAAIAAWRNISDKAPADASRAVRAAEAFRRANFKDQALEYYAKASQLAPDQPEFDEYAGLYLAQLGRQPEAIARLSAMVKGQRDTPANRLRLAELLIQLKALPEALEVLDKAKPAASPDSQTAGIHALRATLLTSLKRYPEAFAAIDQLEAAADSPQRARDARIARAQLHKTLDTLSQAADAQAAKAKSDPTPDNFEMLALYLRTLGRLSDAADAAAQAVTQDPKNPTRIALAADLCIEAGDLLKATAFTRDLLKIQPQRKPAYAQSLAGLISLLSTPEPALTQAQALITLIPDAPQPYLLLSTLQLKLAFPDQALTTLESGVKQNPDDVPLLLALARLQAATNRSPEAAATYWRAYEAATDQEAKLLTIRELTRLTLAQGTSDPLLQKLARKARDTDYEPAHTLALVAAYREAAMPGNAQTVLEEAILRRPTDTQSLQLLIEVTRQQGHREAALQYARRLQTLKPTDQQLSQQIAELLFDVGRPREAITQWQSAQALSLTTQQSPADLALQHARVLSQEGKAAQAVSVLIQAVEVFPDNWLLAMEAGRLAKQSGRSDKAAAIFDRLMRLPASTDPKINTQSPFPNISYLGHKSRAPILNQWVNLKLIQSRCLTEINLSAVPQGSRNMGAVMRYAPPDLSSAQLAALIHRLHIAEQADQLTRYLNQLAAEAGYGPDPASPATQPAQDRPAKLRYLQALILLDLSGQAQTVSQKFLQQDPTFADAAVLNAVFTVASATDSRNALIANSRPATAQDAQDAIKSLQAIAPQAVGDIASLAAEACIARNTADAAASAVPWLDLALKSPPSAEARLDLLGMLVRSRNNTYASQFLPALVSDLRTLAQSPQNQSMPEVFSTLATLSGQALRPDSRTLGIDLCMATLDLLTTPAGRVWLQSQTTQPIFGLEDYLAGPRFRASALLPAEFFDTLQGWSASASIQPKMQSELATRANAWAKAAPQDQKPFAAAAAATLLDAANLNDDARTLLQETAAASDNIDLKLLLARLLIGQGLVSQAQAVLNKIPPVTDPQTARQLSIARIFIALHLKNFDEAKKALAQIDANQTNARESEVLNRIRKLVGLPVVSQPAMAVSSNFTNTRIPVATNNAPPATDGQMMAQFLQSTNPAALETLANRILKDQSPGIMSLMAASDDAAIALAMLARINRLDATIANAVKEWEAQPDDPDACARLLLLYNATGQSDKAEAVLARLVAASPSNMAMRYNYALILHEQDRFAEAAAQFGHVMASQPRLIQSGREVYESYAQANRIDELLKTIDSVPVSDRISLTPTTTPPYDWLIDIAALLRPQTPQTAQQTLDIWLKYQANTGIPFSRSRSDATTPIQLARTADNTQALVGQLVLAVTTAPVKNPGPRPPAVSNTPWIFESTPALVNDVSGPSPALQALKALAAKNQLASLDTALSTVKKSPAVHVLQAMAAALRADPAPAQAILADTVFSQNPANASYMASLALALDTNEKTADLAPQAAALGLKNTKTQNLTLLEAALYDLTARHQFKAGQIDQALKTYDTLLKIPPTAQVPWINQHGPGFYLINDRLRYVPNAIQAQAIVPAVNLIIIATFDPALESSLAPLLANPQVQKAIAARLTSVQQTYDAPRVPLSVTQDLASLYLLTNQPEKARPVLAPFLLEPNKNATGPNGGLIAQTALALAKAGKTPEAEKLVLTLIEAGQPHHLVPLQKFTGCFRDAPSLGRLAAAIEQGTALARQNPRAADWLQSTIGFMDQVTTTFNNSQETTQARQATLQALLAGVTWRRPANQPPNQPQPTSFTTQAFNQYLKLQKPAEAYAFYADAIFSSSVLPIPVDELFTYEPFRRGSRPVVPHCPVSRLVSIAQQTNNLDDLAARTAKALERDPDDFVALRFQLLLAIQKHDVNTALSLMAKGFPSHQAMEEVRYDPSLSVVVLSCRSDKNLIQPALDLYIQSTRTAYFTQAARVQAQDLLRMILQQFDDQSVEPFKQKLLKSTPSLYENAGLKP